MKYVVLVLAIFVASCTQKKVQEPREYRAFFNGIEVTFTPVSYTERQRIFIPQHELAIPAKLAVIEITEQEILYVFVFSDSKFSYFRNLLIDKFGTEFEFKPHPFQKHK